MKNPTSYEWEDLDFLGTYLYEAMRHNLTQETLNCCDQILILMGKANTPQDLADHVIRALRWGLDHTSKRENLGPAHYAREIAKSKYNRFVKIGKDLWDISGEYQHAKRVMNLISSPSLWDVGHPLDAENTPAKDHGMTIYRDALMVLKGQWWWLWLKAVSGWDYWADGIAGRFLGYPDSTTKEGKITHRIKAFQVWEDGQIRCHEKCPPLQAMNDLNEHIELRSHMDFLR